MWRAWAIFALSYCVFVSVDLLWMGGIASDFYRTQLSTLGNAQEQQFTAQWSHWPTVCADWALLVLGSFLFVLPRISGKTMINALGWGGLYGTILYGIFNLSNFALLQDWSWQMVFLDLVWGVCINALLALTLLFLDRKFPKTP